MSFDCFFSLVSTGEGVNLDDLGNRRKSVLYTTLVISFRGHYSVMWKIWGNLNKTKNTSKKILRKSNSNRRAEFRCKKSSWAQKEVVKEKSNLNWPNNTGLFFYSIIRSFIYRVLALLLPLLIRPFIINPLGLLFLIFLSALRSLIFICLYIGTVYGLITFLIYVTGILVLFSYILRLFPNFEFNFQRRVFWVRLACFFNFNFFLDPPFTEESFITTLIGGPNLSVFLTLVLALLFRLIVISVLAFKRRRPLRSR